MATKIAIANQKGGVGKTTTAVNIADALKRCGYDVLFLDLDPQCNSTSSYKAETEDVSTIFDVMDSKVKIHEAIQHTPIGDIIAGDPLMAGEESKYQSKVSGYHIIRKALAEVDDEYDFVVMDTPPNLGIYMLNALTAANGIVIPVKAEKYAIDGLSQLINTVNEVIENTNPNLKVFGVLMTAYDKRNSLDKDIWTQLPQVGEANGFRVFDNPIRVCQAIKVAQAEEVSLFDKDPASTGAIDYAAVVKEILDEI